MNKIFSVLFLLVVLSAPNAQAQRPGPETPEDVLSVSGEVAHPLKLSVLDLAKLPRVKTTVKAHDGKPNTFDGIALAEVLRLAGVEFGEKLRGKQLALFLVVEAADGYRAVFALPELDPAFTDQVIILADHRDGKPLSPEEGPWRIVVPNEKREGRWVRQVAALIIRRA